MSDRMREDDPGGEPGSAGGSRGPARAADGSASGGDAGDDQTPAHLRPFAMHVPRYLAAGPAGGLLAAGGAVAIGAAGAPVSTQGAGLGGLASAAGLLAGSALLRPWTGRVMAKIGPRLMGAQALGLVGVIAFGLLIYSATRPDPRSYGLVVASGFLLGALFQALSFKADLDAAGEGAS
jgi:hypothetical protein